MTGLPTPATFLASLLISILCARACTSAEGAADKPPARVVTLIVDYGDGVQKHFTQIPWRKGATVLHAMEAAQRHPRGIKFEYRGKGATAFLTKIDDLKNEGRGRNWIYRVNGKLADRGFAVFRLKAGDAVLWKFDEYR